MIIEMNGRHSHIKRKLMYGRPGVQAQQGRIDSTFSEFENSFSSTNSKRHTLQDGADKKWASVGEGFFDHDIKQPSAKNIHGKESSDRKPRSTKRKLSDISVVNELKNSAKYSTGEETDEFSANISCLTSDESETETTTDIKECSKGNNSRTKRARFTGTAKPQTKQTTSNPSPKFLFPAIQDIDIKELVVEPGQSLIRIADDCGSSPPTHEQVQEPADRISAYDSDTEDISSIPTSQVNSSEFQETCEDISVPSSTSPTVSPSQTGNKVKAGDWLKNIQWKDKTPTKSNSSSEPDNLEDSAKKKKKYSKCSMADQLSKLQSREKSAQIVWYHKMRESQGQSTVTTQSQECSKSLTMQVMAVEIRCSLFLTTCRQLTDGETRTATTLPSTVNVMFSQNSSNSQTVKIGAVVRMHPPWQTLDIPALGQNILLCSYYSIVNHCPSDYHRLNCDTNTVTSFNAVWKCPCVQDCHIRPDRCPAHTNLCPTSLSTFTQRPSSSTKDVPSTSSNLHTVVDSQTPRSQMSESILDSIEKTGHSTGKGLCFQAVICRVFCKRQSKPPLLNWSILVEDSHGVFALIELPDHSKQLHNWKDVLSGEGLNIRLTGVTLLSRTNRDRDPSLFSVLDCVWRQTTHTAMDCSTDDSNSQLEPVSRPCPGFCYLIKAWQERSGVKLSPNCTVIPDLRAEVKAHSLKEVWNSAVSESDCDERWSFVCKVAYFDDASKSETRPCNNCSHIMYVVDESLMKSSSPLHPLYVMQMCELKDIQPSQSCILFVRDAHVHNGKLICDEYSRVVKLSPPDLESSSPLIPEELQSECEVLKTMTFKPHHLNRDSVLRELVTVRGKIISVNEDECYIWPECDHCGNGHLTSDSNTDILTCPSCHCPVHSPVTRIKMEVFVDCPELDTGQFLVQLQLHQSTVERLLPVTDSQEGYDISCVMNVAIGPLTCIIREKVTNQHEGTITVRLEEVRMIDS